MARKDKIIYFLSLYRKKFANSFCVVSHCRIYNLLIPCTIYRHLSYFLVLVMTNSIAMNILLFYIILFLKILIG